MLCPRRPPRCGQQALARRPQRVSCLCASRFRLCPLGSYTIPLLTGGSAKDVVWDPTPLTDAATFPNTPQELLDDTIVHAATGRHHTVLVTASGAAYVAGQNSLGQAGQDTATYKEVKHFTKVDVNGDKVVMASAGISFTLFLTSKGQVWAVGMLLSLLPSPSLPAHRLYTGGAEKGQLGHGKVSV